MAMDLPPILPGQDFWSRRDNAQTHAFECAPLGVPARITANRPEVLDAARLSAGRYSAADVAGGEPMRIQIAVGRAAGDPAPGDLPAHLTYTGIGEWIMMSAERWGHAFANLDTRTACLALSRELADDVRQVSRYFIDHYILNLLLTDWAMLHASCAYDAARGSLIALVAGHDAGKSTTALRLARAGISFLADGMLLLKHTDRGWVAGGYPIGEVKLRQDVLAWFPEYAGQAIRVREHDKTIVDLRAAHPDRVIERLVTPAEIHLCFVERHHATGTRLAPIDAAAALASVSANTVFWDRPDRLSHNTAALRRLLASARLHRVTLGTDADGIVAALAGLAG